MKVDYIENSKLNMVTSDPFPLIMSHITMLSSYQNVIHVHWPADSEQSEITVCTMHLSLAGGGSPHVKTL